MRHSPGTPPGSAFTIDTMIRAIRTSVVAATAGVLLVAPAVTASATEPAPHFVAQNGTSDCWGKGRTLWHFIVRNDGTKGGRYQVEYQRGVGDPVRHYSSWVPKRQGNNDGLLIHAGETISYVRVSSKLQGDVFFRRDVTGRERCESRA